MEDPGIISSIACPCLENPGLLHSETYSIYSHDMLTR